MILCMRLWTGDDAESHFEDGSIELELGRNGDLRQDRRSDGVLRGDGRAAARSTGTLRRCASSSSR